MKWVPLERRQVKAALHCPSKEIRDAIIDSVMEAGMQESMDALERVATSLR